MSSTCIVTAASVNLITAKFEQVKAKTQTARSSIPKANRRPVQLRDPLLRCAQLQSMKLH